MKRALILLALAACATPPPIEDMEPAPGPGVYDVGDVNLRAALPFDPADPPDVVFLSPTVELPYWGIGVRLGNWDGGPEASLSEVRIDERPVTDYFLFVNGEAHEAPWITRKAERAENVFVVVKTLWENGATYRFDAMVVAPEAGTMPFAIQVTAPIAGGGPGGCTGFDSFVLSDSTGLDRWCEPTEIVVSAADDECGNLAEEVRLFEVVPSGLIEQPCQAFDHRRWSGHPPLPRGLQPKNRGRWSSPSQSVRLAFLADVPAHGHAIYCVAYGGAPASARPAPSSPLVRSEADDGSTVIENGCYRVDLHPKCGQLDSFVLVNHPEVPAFTNSTSGTVHWNPDVYDDKGWGHAFSWDPPERTVVSADGPILYRVTRSGRMPSNNAEVELSVTYSFWAGAPWVRMQSSMRVTDDFGASAIRNGEMVFDADLFDAICWKEKSGRLRKIRALHRPDPLIDAPATPAADIPWVALYNTSGRWALGSVALTAYAYDPLGGNPSVYRPAYFLYCHPFWNRPLTYFVRAWVYPFGYNDRMPAVPVRAGSTYVEDAAYLPFLLDEDEPFRPIEDLDRRLRAPLEIRYGH